MICICYDMWLLCCIWWIDMFLIWYVKEWYVEDMLGICYVTVIIYDILCAWCVLLCLKAWKCYDMIYVRHEWYDMIDMQNDKLAWNTTPT